MILTLLLTALSSSPAAQRPEAVKAPPAGTEISAALEAATRKNQRVLLVWGEGQSEAFQQLDALLGEDRGLARKLLFEYQVVRLKAEETDSYTVLAQKYGAKLEAGSPHLTILAADGLVLANENARALTEADRFDPRKLQAFLEKHQAPYKDAKVLLDAAITKAEAQLKRVFLVFDTPECAACRDLEARIRLPEVQPLLEKEFIFCVVDLERTVGGKDLLAQMRGSKEEDTPWYAVLMPDRMPVVDSDDLTGKNLGCPKSAEELEVWAGFLKRAKQYLTDEEIGQITAAFRKAAEAAPARAGNSTRNIPER